MARGRKEGTEMSLDTIQDVTIQEYTKDVAMKEVLYQRTFKHKSIIYSCTLHIANGLKVDVIEGKVSTDNESIIKTLLNDGWYEITPYTSKRKPIQVKTIIEWHYKLPNGSDIRKFNGRVGVMIDNKNVMLDVIDNIVETNDKLVSEQLKKNGWLLTFTKEEIKEI
jgi:hypothetical protein